MTKMETCCTTCSHQIVCSLKSDLLKAQETLNDVSIPLERSTSDGRVAYKHLYDFDFILPVVLRCKYYEKSKDQTLRDVL